jgi:micrococcal nuclease
MVYNDFMYEYHVKKVHKVVDGDTIDVDIDLGFNVSYFQRVRLAGIDTPESRTTDEYEKKLGLEAKEWLKHKLEGAENIMVVFLEIFISKVLINH